MCTLCTLNKKFKFDINYIVCADCWLLRERKRGSGMCCVRFAKVFCLIPFEKFLSCAACIRTRKRASMCVCVCFSGICNCLPFNFYFSYFILLQLIQSGMYEIYKSKQESEINPAIWQMWATTKSTHWTHFPRKDAKQISRNFVLLLAFI